MARKTHTEENPDGLFVPLQAHTWGDGVLTTADTLRGTHPAVVANPELFAPLGTSTDERVALLQSRFPIVGAEHETVGPVPARWQIDADAHH